jgi:hypothetical protein
VELSLLEELEFRLLWDAIEFSPSPIGNSKAAFV